MIPTAFVIPGDLSLTTGGYAYDRRVLALFARCGIDAAHIALPASYPAPSAADLVATRRVIAATSDDAVLLIDGLAYGAMPRSMIERFGRPIVALVHHPLCLEAGLTPARQADLKTLETDALNLADHVIATSATTMRTLVSDFSVPPEKITIAEPGTDPATRAHGSGGATPALLAVGSILPRKGYDRLAEALGSLADRPWTLTIAGAADRSPDALAALHDAIRANRLDDRVVLAGAVPDAALARLYGAADVFVSSSFYEGYGMVLAEAMARGLAIVTTTGGAAAETVPDGAALKVPPDDVPALRSALARVIGDAGERRRLADASWAAGQRLPRWDDTARRIAAAIKTIR